MKRPVFYSYYFMCKERLSNHCTFKIYHIKHTFIVINRKQIDVLLKHFYNTFANLKQRTKYATI